MQTYLFYDIETTGLSKSFDQVLQFAAIRTDSQLNELDRHEIRVKLNPDVIPSPYAILTHKISMADMMQGLPEFEAIKQIHGWLNTPGTISLGYNTLGFDDEFLRFSFYRNLLTPYTHQYANQCYRMDIYPVAVMFYLFKNSVLAWPEINGKISLKLEEINKANQLVTGRAHDAMVDVLATKALAARFLHEKDMWDYLQGAFKKEIDIKRSKELQQTLALCINGKWGSQNHYQYPVFFLGDHLHYKNQTVWLRLDNPELMQVTQDTIADKTMGLMKKPGEPNFMLPCQTRFLQHITPERLQLAQQNQQWLEDNPTLLDAIRQYHRNFTWPPVPEADQDARLYLDGFRSDEETRLCQRFHTANLKTKVDLMQRMSTPALKTQALRILGRHYPDNLSPADSEIFAHYMRTVNPMDEGNAPIDYQGKKRLTPRAALREIETIRSEKELDGTDETLLTDFERWLKSAFKLA